MRIDRRGFMGVAAAVLGLLGGCRSQAEGLGWIEEIHRGTRNTRFGPVGRRWPRLGRPPRRYKPYSGAGRVALPEPQAPSAMALGAVIAGFQEGAGFSSEPLSLAELSRLLHFSNGVTGARGGVRLRAAPSAGALYAGEIYVVARGVRDLEPGVYYYSPVEHALASVEPGPRMAQVERSLEQPGPVAGAPVAVLLSNVFERYGRRYANRGYRYALIDSGHIGENLRLGARSAGLVEVSPLRFEDDRLNALLEIDGRREAVCALHAVGRAAAVAPTGGPSRTLVERQLVEPVPRDGPLPERYHTATRLVAAEGPARAPGVARGAERPAAAERGAWPDATVESCILRRRSAESFAQRPISRPTLDWLLAAGRGGPAIGRAPGVSLHLAVHRVDGQPPGLYRFDRIAGLVSVRGGDLREPLVRACLGQEKVGTSAVAFFMVARLRGEGAPRVDRGYRDLLIESGAIGQRIYLAAEASGLAARNLAAFRDDELNRVLGLDGATDAVIHLTAVGFEG